MKIKKIILAVFITVAMLMSQLPMSYAASTAPKEQFSLTPGDTYYFDLSSQGIPGTANYTLPDTSLKWVPFTYVGTVNAYSLDVSSIKKPEASNNATPNNRSLFVADKVITHTVSWNQLNGGGLIFGKNYIKQGVSYKLRSLSVGNDGGYTNTTKGSPATNEWDQILDKNESYIKIGDGIMSLGQDTNAVIDPIYYIEPSVGKYRSCSLRGDLNGNVRDFAYGGIRMDESRADFGFRPTLEILNPGVLGTDGLKTVTFDMGTKGTLGNKKLTIAKVVYNGTLTLPEVTAANGFNYTGSGTGNLGWYVGSKYYEPGTEVTLDSGTVLRPGFDNKCPEQFSIAPGGTYYFDLSEQGVPGTVNPALPDAGLKWVPFTYVGTIEAYSLDSSSSGNTTASGNATASERSLFVSYYNVTKGVAWDELNNTGLIFGKNYISRGVSYDFRSLSVGSDVIRGENGIHMGGIPESNEWDRILNKDIDYIKNDNYLISWGQDTNSNDSTRRVLRGGEKVHYSCFFGSDDNTYNRAFRAALEILNPTTLGFNSLKTVTFNMGSQGTIGDKKTMTAATLVYTGKLTLPAITESNGFNFTGSGTGKLGWYAGSTFYQQGATVTLPTGTSLIPGYEMDMPTDLIGTLWGKSNTYVVTSSRTIDLTSCTPNAGNLTITASGNTADVKIVGDTNVTYKNLHIYIEKGAHVSLHNVNIDNSSDSVEYSPVEAGDSNTGNTLYTMELNNLTGSKNMPGVFVAEGTNLNIFRSSDPMAGTARLYANGGTDAAGIGGKNGGGAGTISFNKGSVTAKGNGGGSGIGGGKNGIGGTVSVVNAIITAQKGSDATYDIGGGQGAAGGKSYITSGVVFASDISNIPEVSKEDSTPLGKKSLKFGDAFTSINYIRIDNTYLYGNMKADSNGYLNVYFSKGTHSIVNVEDSKIYITSDSSSDYLLVTKQDGASYTCYSVDNSANINICESGTYLVSGNTTLFKSSIRISPDINANITLDNVRLSADNSGLSLDLNTTVNLTINGTNTLIGGNASPGISVPKTSVLNITGTASDLLTIEGKGSAGISNSGAVSISGGKITANGGMGGSGIGGDGIVTVTGGTIKAVKGNGATFDIEGGTCYFSGGSINTASISCPPVISNTDSTPVYFTILNLVDNKGLALMDTMFSCSMPNGVKFNAVTDNEGRLYLWLPAGNNTMVTLSSGEKTYKATANITNSGPNIMTTAATVSGITVSPATTTVQKGNTQTFSAEVTGTNNPEQTVAWSVSGNNSKDTTISSSGELTVATDETASTLTVTATSAVDTTKSGTAAVTVTDVPAPEPKVDSVTVSPSTATVQKGKTQTFSVTVAGTNNPAHTVTWSVSGNNSTETTINSSGELTVASGETSSTLTVTATSAVDTTKSGTAAVTVTDVPAPEPKVDSVTVSPSTATVQKGKTQTFNATVAGSNNPEQTVAWSVSGNNSKDTTISNSGVLTVATDETASTLTVTATSAIDNTKLGTSTVSVTDGNVTPPSTGGGGNTTVTPPVETPKTEITIRKDNEAITATTTATATSNSAGNASASVTESQVSDAVKKSIETAAKENEGTAARVEIKINAPADSKTVETSLPKKAIDAVAESKAAAFTVATPVAAITFDDKSLDTISGQAAGDVKITAAKADVSTLSEETRQAVGDRPVFNFSVISGDKTISQFGGSVTVAVPYTPKPGEDPNAIVIYYINAQGKLEMVSNCKYDPATGTVSFATTHFSQYAVGYNKVSFKDVSEDAWYSKAVGFIAARGITAGAGNGQFGPEQKLTRGQFIVMVMKAYGINPDQNPAENFADAGNTYYTNYLAAAKRLGITGGIGNNRFAPNNEITRQEMFVLLYNALKATGNIPQVAGTKTLSEFSDGGNVASWAKNAMTFFVQAGKLSGTDGRLSPTSTTSRAEMAQVLFNLLSE